MTAHSPAPPPGRERLSRFPLRWLSGPELCWLALYGLTVGLTRLNVPPSDAGNLWMERLGMWLLPLIGVPLASACAFGPGQAGASRARMWARLMLATLMGLNACLIRVAEAIDYHDTRNAGVLGVWMMGFIMGLLALAVTALALHVAVRRSRSGPPA